ncbi:uncharacterized protein MONBRDRAFT_21013 [Monosiga brevicollis MX1]|uniref:Septin-type G domain-containing protein n=1 Tax=Monosiga brevicollis TaxID=81824 RepID=A9UP35_MONBE|nr:uncharacterized protein MONBRDRAFT_21013 [Monosiga brevicollis MX1]EDQ92804.1 predicted protein [Monosiga brevicollis MX1]|eukprot:XP_001742566.1 hypothetical protein [Monosiga brevicollis MX1]
MGLSGIQRQVFRKVAKKGYDFTLMVAGASGLGKSTLVRTLFMQPNDETDTDRLAAADRIASTVEITERTKTIGDAGFTLRLTIIDTPGFADAVNNTNCWQPLVEYIDSAFELSLQEENKLDRSNVMDKRVHALLYFIDPSARGLKPLDIAALKALHEKVNIIPVIGKSDMLTKGELKALKAQIQADIQEHHIQLFRPAVDDEDEESYKLSLRIAGSMPFALVGSDTVLEAAGGTMRGRRYPWGVVEVDNPDHCDFDLLRNTLVKTHLQDLKDSTAEVLYELYRREKLSQGGSLNVTANTSVTPASRASPDASLAGDTEMYEQKQRELEEQARRLEEERRRFEAERRKFEVFASQP